MKKSALKTGQSIIEYVLVLGLFAAGIAGFIAKTQGAFDAYFKKTGTAIISCK